MAGNVTKLHRTVTDDANAHVPIVYDPALKQIRPRHFVVPVSEFTLNAQTKPHSSIALERLLTSITMNTFADEQGDFQLTLVELRATENVVLSVLSPAGYSTMESIVVFDGAASKDAEGSMVSFDWAFGDGETAAGVQVWHQFPRSGRFPVVLTATDDASLANSRDADTLFVTVNQAPRALMTIAAQACAGEHVAFSSAKSFDEDGKIAGYRWDFGDGSFAESA